MDTSHQRRAMWELGGEAKRLRKPAVSSTEDKFDFGGYKRVMDILRTERPQRTAAGSTEPAWFKILCNHMAVP